MVVLRVLTPSSLSKSGDGEGLSQGGVIAVAIFDSFSVLLCAALGSCWWIFIEKISVHLADTCWEEIRIWAVILIHKVTYI